MITKVILQNFKCFGEPATEIELKPLTIFVGPNGSGKSSVLEAVGILAQSALALRDHYGLIWGKGPFPPAQELLVSLPSKEAMFHKLENKRRVKIGAFARLALSALNERLRETGLPPTQVSDWGYLVEYCGDTDEYVHELRSSETLLVRNNRRLTFRYEGGGGYKDSLEFPKDFPDKEFLPMASDRILSADLFMPREIGAFQKGNQQYESVKKYGSIGGTLSQFLRDSLSKVYYLVAERSLREEGANGIKDSPDDVGKFGERTFPLLNVILGSAAHAEVADKIKRWAISFGMADLHAVDFRDPDYHIPLDLHLAGHGSRQMLPVIIQVFWAQPGSIIMIEEPEISLHPDAQAKLPEMFAEAVAEGKQLIITSHSGTPLLALPKALEKITRDEIVVHHFNKSRDGVSVTQLEITEEGYVRDWIPSFAEVEKRLMGEWFDRVGDKLAEEP